MKWFAAGRWLVATALGLGAVVAPAQVAPIAPAMDIQMTEAQALAAFSAPGSLSANPQALARAQALLGSMDASSPRRVLVRLNQGWLPEATVSATLGAQAVQEQRSGIAATRTGVLSSVPATVLRTYDALPFVAMRVNQAQLGALIQHPGVAGIEEDLPHQPGLNEAVPQVHQPSATQFGLTGVGQAVAVLDTGVLRAHPFLGAAKVVQEACFSSDAGGASSLCPDGSTQQIGPDSANPYTNNVCTPGACDHGTHVAGIVAGSLSHPGPSEPAQGMAPQALIAGVQVFSWVPNGCDGGTRNCPLAYSSDIIAGLQWVYDNRSAFSAFSASLSAVNMSLGGGRFYEQNSCDIAYAGVKAAIDQLRAVGVATVISSGNSYYRDSTGGPGCVSTAVSVGAVCDTSGDWACPAADGVDKIANYSNIAPFVSLLAPGSYITSSVSGDGYEAWSGTSMAAPMVAGAWALMKQKAPDASVADILHQLRTQAVTLADTRSGGTATNLKRFDLAFLARSLVVSKTGSTGSGTVSDGTSLNCDVQNTACSANFLDGTQTTLTATADQGSTFVGWGGACSGAAATCTVTMDGAKSVTARFNTTGGGGSGGDPLTTPGIAVTKVGSGAGTVGSSPAVLNCGSLCTKALPNGSKITLTAIAAPGSVFTGWSGAQAGQCANSTQRMCQVTVRGGMNITATFIQQAAPVSLNVSLGGQGTGVVSSAPGGINCGATCTGNFANGTPVTLTAQAHAGSTFAGWSGGGCSGTGSCTVTLSNATSVTATFALLPQWARLNFKGLVLGTSNTVNLTSGHTTPCVADTGYDVCVLYPIGTEVTLEGVADTGYRFAGWGEDCAGTAAADSCTLTMSETRNVALSFKLQRALAAAIEGPGSGRIVSAAAGLNCSSSSSSSAGCTVNVDNGDTVVLTATPNPGSTFIEWSEGPCSTSTTPSCSVTMNQARSVKASFNLMPLSTPGISITKTGSGDGTVGSSPAYLNCGTLCSKALPRGTVVTLTAIAKPGSAFSGWSGPGAGVCANSPQRICRVTVTGPMEIEAIFND